MCEYILLNVYISTYKCTYIFFSEPTKDFLKHSVTQTGPVYLPSCGVSGYSDRCYYHKFVHTRVSDNTL